MEFKSALLRKTALPEVARFGGMSFHVYYNEHVPPHFSVRLGSGKDAAEYRFDFNLNQLPTQAGALAGRYKVQIKEWFRMQLPTGKSVGNEMYDNWVLNRQGKKPVKIPTPQQLKNQQTKNRIQPKKAAGVDYTSFHPITAASAISPFKLKVLFESGECKLVDIQGMRGNHPAFAPLWNWNEFKKVRFTPNVVEWFQGINALEIEDQDLWAAGDSCTSG